MDSTINLCLQRAENELVLANIIQRISQSEEMKKNVFQVAEDSTFYSAVISHSYYAIFYSAKAYLISQGVKFVSKQGQHQKVHHEFTRLVKKGVIDKELLRIYDDAKMRAETLLEIIKEERKKRTEFTYEKLPQANQQPAQDSLTNASLFVTNMAEFVKAQKQ